MANGGGIYGWFRTAKTLAYRARDQRSALRNFQSERLRRLVRHAWDNVAFYREAFICAGVKPDDVRGIQDLHLLPIVEKDDLRRTPLPDRLARGSDSRKLLVRHTSGSTGRPFTIHRTVAEDRLLYLFRLRAQRQYGLRIRDYAVSVSEPPIGGHQRAMLGRVRHRLGIFRRDVVNCSQPNEAILRELNRLAPNVINGYPAALASIAPLVPHAGLPDIRPRLIHTGGEPLLPHFRQRIRDGFGVDAFDVYGAHEFNLIAWECPQGGPLHVCDDNIILEVVREGKPVDEGARGEVVVTGLHSFTMPFIRYRMGDIVTRGVECCDCGQPFSTLSQIQGRSAHYFQLGSQGFVHPFEITGPMLEGETGWINQFQLVQKTSERLVLRIDTRGVPPRGAVERLEQLGRRIVHPPVEFCIELVDAFPPYPSGKFQPYVSLGQPE